MSDPKLFSLDDQARDFNPYDPQKVYDTMMLEKGLEFGFNIDVKDPRSDRTMSKEAMDALMHNMISWVGTRIARKFKATGKGAKQIQVTVTVSLDGEERTLRDYTADVPYFSWPDDQHRRGK